MTLLEMFIKDMNGCFQEPDRKGTAKGQEIGIFHNKYNAALHSLYNYEQKEIAKRAEISFSYYRKMRTEDNYKIFASRIVNDFAEHFVCAYLQKGSVYKHTYATSFARTGIRSPHSVVIPMSANIDSVFGDVADYSKELKSAIFDYILNLYKKLNIKSVIQTSDRVIYLLRNWNEPEFNKAIFKTAIGSSSTLVSKILNEANASEDERLSAIAISHFILKLSDIL